MTFLTLTDADGQTLHVPEWFGFTYTSIRNPVSIIEAGSLHDGCLWWEPDPADDESDVPEGHPALTHHKLRLPVTVTCDDGPMDVDSCVLRHDLTGPSVNAVVRVVLTEDRAVLELPDGPPVSLTAQPGGEWRWDMDAVDRLPESLGGPGDYSPGWGADGRGWSNDWSAMHDPVGDPLVRGDVSDWFINAPETR